MAIGASVWGRSKRLRSRLSAALTLALAACSGEGPSDPGEPAVVFGSLVVTISGLPAGASANVTVTGPAGFTRVVTTTTTLTGLSAGGYSLIVADVTHEGSTYTGSYANQTLVIAAGATINAPSVSYLIATGSMAITLGGLPQSTSGQVVVSGPDGFNRTITEATSINGLKPGTYQVEAREVQTPNARYAASYGTQQVTISASVTPSQVNVVYALATGSMTININGLPQGVNAAVLVTGPGTSAPVTASTVIEKLAPGIYNVSASGVTSGSLYQPAPPSQAVTVTASTESAVANIFYVSAGTTLSVNVAGLPANVPASITVTGPNGFSNNLTGTQVLSAITPGVYTITAAPVGGSCVTYTPAPSTQNATVVNGLTTSATVTYAIGSGGLNLCIDGAYITQSVQAYDNSVPLVANRNALLRVFVRASAPNAAQPNVRVRFFNGTTLLNTMTIPAPSFSVPTLIDEGTINSTWNTTLNGSLLQPGLRMLVDVDPANAFAEANENDNSFPANGTAAPLDIRTVSTLNVRIVPVIQQARGDTGRVTDANKGNFITPMMKMFPVASIDAEVRLPYTYTGPELQSGGSNWSALLNELNALRVLEASGRSYYGIVRVGYTSGVAGLGYIGVPTAMGWDHQPSGTEVMAHEMGHNFGRLHAPCGNPQGVDSNYPYASASIGVYGFDVATGVQKAPAFKDLMSYCDPSWISDYTYKAIMNFRATNPLVQPLGRIRAGSSRGLLVWGRIEAGQPILEPAIEVDAPATLPTRGGPHRLEGFGAAGEPLFSLVFAGDRIGDAPDPNDETFSFVVPLSQLRGISLDRLRLSARGQQVEHRGARGAGAPVAQRMSSGRVRVTWDASVSRVALVRDARTGAILSLARGGSVDLPAGADDLDVTLSNGVRSVQARVRPR